jgi:hypothetical protein
MELHSGQVRRSEREKKGGKKDQKGQEERGKEARNSSHLNSTRALHMCMGRSGAGLAPVFPRDGKRAKSHHCANSHSPSLLTPRQRQLTPPRSPPLACTETDTHTHHSCRADAAHRTLTSSLHPAAAAMYVIKRNGQQEQVRGARHTMHTRTQASALAHKLHGWLQHQQMLCFPAVHSRRRLPLACAALCRRPLTNSAALLVPSACAGALR